MSNDAWRLCKTVLLLLFLLFLLAAPSHGLCASGPVSVSTTPAGTINLKADNVPLSQVIQDLSRKCDLDIRGTPLGNETISLDVAGKSLEETLRKILRGYNYVLMGPDHASRGSVMVLGKAQRIAYSSLPSTPPPEHRSVESRNRGSAPPTASGAIAGQGSASVAYAAGSSTVPETGGQRAPVSAGSSSSEQAWAGNTPAPSTFSSLQQTSGSSAASPGSPSSSSLVPPVPPQMAGLEPPPSPPLMPTKTSVENPSAPPQTDKGLPVPPQVPSGGTSQPPQLRPDLMPPQIPF